MRPVRIGIVGAGIGRQHARTLAKVTGAQLVGMADLDPQRRAEATGEAGCPGYDSLAAMLAEAKPDGVLLCTPPYVRLELIERLATAGVAVFCEKPPALEEAAARAVRRVLDRSGVLQMAGFMYRYARVVEAARQRLGGRQVLICQIIGIWEVLFWMTPGSDYFHRHRVGGPMVEQGVHLIDVARYVLGDEVVRVHARGANLAFPVSDQVQTEDTVQASLLWSRGTVGSHVHCWAHHGHVFELRFVGVDFALTLDLKNHRLHGTDGGESVDRTFPGDDYPLTQLQTFCDAIATGDRTPIRSTYADACRTLAVALAANRSVDTGLDLPVSAF